ncbi:MAG: DUF3048 domain-containing protein [Patescibacteria group bacterium]
MEVRYFLSNLIFKIRYERSIQIGILISFLVAVNIGVWGGILYALNASETQAVEQVAYLPEIGERDDSGDGAVLERRLDGMMVSAQDANKPPIAVMIENAAFDQVRPQYGLSKALVIYEVIVESGITRFMAVFAGDDIPQIGPVRSARPTYLEFASEYDAFYAHAGGSPEALSSIEGLGIKDMNALTGDSRFFWRDTSRFAPHNLYTSWQLLTTALKEKGFNEKTPDFIAWNFKNGKPAEERTEEQRQIKLFFSNPSYDVEWNYDKENNYYTRINGGELQHDALNQETLSAKNVIVQIVPPLIPAGEKGRVNFNVTGEGLAYIFRDGEIIEGTWKKKDRLSRTIYFDNNKQEVELIRGNTWVEILPEDRTFEYK